MEYITNRDYTIKFYDTLENKTKSIIVKGNKVNSLLKTFMSCNYYKDINVKIIDRKNSIEKLINKLQKNNIIFAGNSECEYITVIKDLFDISINIEDDKYKIVVKYNNEYNNKKEYKTLAGVIKYINSL